MNYYYKSSIFIFLIILEYISCEDHQPIPYSETNTHYPTVSPTVVPIVPILDKIACPDHNFTSNVDVSCILFPYTPRDKTYIRVVAKNMIDYDIRDELTNDPDRITSSDSPFYIKVNPFPDLIPDIIQVQDPSLNINKLIGVALDGIPIYSSLIIPGEDIFQQSILDNNEFEGGYRLDQCGGCYGNTPDGYRYHYRIMPSCLFDDDITSNKKRQLYITNVHELLENFVNFREPVILGYSTTGYPIFAPYNERGLLHTNLDNCNGKFANGAYAYYVTPVFPYISGCDGPGVFSTHEMGSTLEDLPNIINVEYNACPGGQYPSVEFASNGCVKCPSGKYSYNTYNHALNSGKSMKEIVCNMDCPLGYFCPVGSVKPIKCPAGRYGSSTNMKDSLCSGPCKQGYYCRTGSTRNDVSPCGNSTQYCPTQSSFRNKVEAGFYTIPEDDVSTSLRYGQMKCGPGTYCFKGERFPCPAGTYGESEGLTTNACTAPCPRGYYCPVTSIHPIKCPAGTYGADLGMENDICSGKCIPGYWCPSGSISSMEVACEAGRYGKDYGLTTRECSLICELSSAPNATSSDGTKFCEITYCAAGYYCPLASISATQIKCGASNMYCPPGSVLPLIVDIGYYTTGPLSPPFSTQNVDDQLIRFSQEKCEPGHYCLDNGIKYKCPRGHYGIDYGSTNIRCNGYCDAGYICDENSHDSKQYSCGLGASVYCPEGSWQVFFF
jgi:hypothetical protein